MANSYKCPLCISTHSYGSLEALEVHLDNVHIGKPARPNILDYITYPATPQNNFDQFVEASINLELNKYADGTVKVSGVELGKPYLQSSKSLQKLFPSSEQLALQDQNEMLREKVLRLQNGLDKKLEDLNHLKRENQSMKSDLTTVCSYMKTAADRQKVGRRQLADYVHNLIEEIEAKEREVLSLENSFQQTAGRLRQLQHRPSTHYQQQYQYSSQPSLTVAPSNQLSDKLGSLYRSSVSFDVADARMKSSMVQSTSKVADSITAALVTVFKLLPVKDRLNCSHVCMSWRQMCLSPPVWQLISMKNQRFSAKLLQHISAFATETSHIVMEGIDPLLDNATDARINLTGHFDSGLEMIFRCCSDHLVFLKVSQCHNYISHRVVGMVASYCRRLQQLHFFSRFYPITAEAVWVLGANCRLIHTLAIGQTHQLNGYHQTTIDIEEPTNSRIRHKSRETTLKLDDNVLRMIAKCWPHSLRVLSVGCRNISLRGLLFIGKYCVKLASLELEDLHLLNADDAKLLCHKGFVSLRQLTFVRSYVDIEALHIFYLSLSNLKSLFLVIDPSIFKSGNVPSYQEYLQSCEELVQTTPGMSEVFHIRWED